MRILSIRGENLASLPSFHVDFEAPPLAGARLFAVTGPTGSGKTTLLDALCLALFDRTPRLGDARKGNRPSFVAAAPPDQANALYEEVATLLRARGVPVATGVFRAHMEVELVNDGPVTLILDSRP